MNEFIRLNFACPTSFKLKFSQENEGMGLPLIAPKTSNF